MTKRHHSFGRLRLLVLAVVLEPGGARADCADPLRCFAELCTRRGNVVELTVMTPVGDHGVVTVRVDGVRVIDGELYATPLVGSEFDIYSDVRAIGVGDQLVGLAREAGNLSWALFGRDEEGGVTCLPVTDVPGPTLTLEQLESVVRLGRCDQGAPLPEPLKECHDVIRDECGVGRGGSLIAAIGLWLLRRRSKSIGDRV